MLKMTFLLLFPEGWALLQLTGLALSSNDSSGKEAAGMCAAVVQNVSEAEMHGEP